MSAPVPRLAVLAVVLRGEQVLLVRRANPPDAGLWGYPGGKVDWGETVEAAALRELAEETGLTPHTFYATSFCEQFYDAGNDCIMVIPAFVARVDDDCVVRLNGEHSAWCWLTFEAAMNELEFGSQRDLFSYVQREFIARPPSKHLRIGLD